MAQINDEIATECLDRRSKEKMGKYDPLREYLIASEDWQLDLTFESIESIVGEKLPRSAFVYREWGSNEEEGTHVQAHSWTKAAWRVVAVDLASRRVFFTREL